MCSVAAPTVGTRSNFASGLTDRESSQYHIMLGPTGRGSADASLVVLVSVKVAKPFESVRAVKLPLKLAMVLFAGVNVTSAFATATPELLVTV